MTTGAGALRIEIDQQAVHWAGLQCWLGLAPRLIGGEPHVHTLDAAATLDPLLRRPGALGQTNRVVVVDPGHGGRDGGSNGSERSQLEKIYALDWALRVRALLRTNGWRVFVTRTNDADVPLQERVALAERVGADLFISLHFNSAFPYVQRHGIETFCLTPAGLTSTLKRGNEDDPRQAYPNNGFDADNVRWAWRLHRELLASSRAADGGIRRARFMKVLREQRRPAVLIEGGYLSNPIELERISSAGYRQELAEAVARALD